MNIIRSLQATYNRKDLKTTFIKNKESCWNSRFTLGKIPQYKAQEDPHLQPYILKTSQKKIAKIRSLSPLSFKASRLKIKTKVLLKLEEDYKTTMKLNRIDDCFSECFLNSIENDDVDSKTLYLITEIRNLHQGSSIIQEILRSIDERESIILYLKESILAKEITTEDLEKGYTKSLSKLRTLSIRIVLKIIEWKESLIIHNPTSTKLLSVEFLWRSENYLKKLKFDLNFLSQSQLSKFFHFSAKNDPFLVYPSNINTKNQKKFIIPIKNSLAELRFCELKLMQE